MKRFLALLFSLLLCMVVSNLHAQKLTFNVAEFGIDEFDMTPQEEERYDPDGHLYAIVKVTSDNEDDDLNAFKFDFGYLQSTKEMHDGEIWLFVQRNAKHVTITREGYKTVKYSFSAIQAGRTYRMNLCVQTPEIKHRILQFMVDPADEGAIVKVKREDSSEDYDFWGTVDALGSIDRRLPTGVYLYEVSASNYTTSTGRVNLIYDSKNLVEHVKLLPNFGFLKISDEYGIAGAEVYIDNKKVGTVPYQSDRMECRDDYQLMISKGEFYKTYTSTFSIRKGETTTITPKLASNFAETTIQVEGNAEIFIDDERRGTGSWTGPLRAGIYNVECRMANHRSSKRQITVKPDETETFIIAPPQPIEGSLYITSNPSGAAIYIDGENTGLVTPHTIEHILIGSHNVSLRLANHKTEEFEQILIEENKTAEIKATLGNIARMTLKSVPENASLYLNGTYKGTTPFSAEMASGDYDIRIEKRRYATISQRIHLDSSNPVQTFQLKRQYLFPKEFYLQPTFQVGSCMGVGAAMGFYLFNFNVEAEFQKGLGAETVYLNQGNGYYYDTEEISYMQYGGKLGWGIILGSRYRVTPQLGIALLSAESESMGAWCLKGSVGVRAEMALMKHIGIVLSPAYSFAVRKSDVFTQLSDLSSKVKGWGCGFNCAVGLNFFF